MGVFVVELISSNPKGEIVNIQCIEAAPRYQMDAAPFRTAHDAIKFAVTRDGGVTRPPSSRMLDAMMPASDFAGQDGAAQAGMILNALEPIGRLAVSTLIASATPKTIPCECRRPCCCGHKLSSHWRTAIDTITFHAKHALPAGSKLNYGLREAIILKIYGDPSTYKDIAESLLVDEETVSRHHRAILAWLRGAKARRNVEAIEGVEPAAWREAESILRDANIVG